MTKAARKTDTRTRQAYQRLKSLLMDNALKPSASYLETELADMLGMSRTPVREAALQLESEGFLSIRPRHGITILPISIEDMQDIYELLTELEPYAAERLARAGLSDSGRDLLMSHVSAMETALDTDDLVAWAKADEAFHMALVRLAGNQRLSRMVATFWDQVHRARMATLTLRPRPVRSNEDHRRLVDYLAAGDWEAARKLHRDHRENAKNMLVDLITHHNLNHL
uniref:GntR family transcriptional regulator n=1 Tax=Pararhizobium sp. IMCC3301 TaxID=3067904 RepID=UPI002740A7B6|nr:GntR family transcriptional regulator [Pararhizobium sp. IMCC3301]